MDNVGRTAVGFLEKPYKRVKADNGGIRFTILVNRRLRETYSLRLFKSKGMNEPAYVLKLSENSELVDVRCKMRAIKFKIRDFYRQDTHEFCLSWVNDEICLGRINEPPLLRYPQVMIFKIGIVEFQTQTRNAKFLEVNVENPPIIHVPTRALKKVEGGELRWVRMTSGDPLPIDALIGGMENEPLYIARALHNGSLCPGKYVNSMKTAFVPWGHTEFVKCEFEILCGYDATWVKCFKNFLPENAFIGGYSEVKNEPLFIGRAWVNNHLIVGKVHLLYSTCYLPYQNKEVETSNYETLVVGNSVHYSNKKDQLAC